jgi:hypothetical protein
MIRNPARSLAVLLAPPRDTRRGRALAAPAPTVRRRLPPASWRRFSALPCPPTSSPRPPGEPWLGGERPRAAQPVGRRRRSLRARAVTSFTDDDGQPLQEVAWCPGRARARLRAWRGGRGAAARTLKPSSADAEMGRTCGSLPWTAPRRGRIRASAGAPAISPRGEGRLCPRRRGPGRRRRRWPERPRGCSIPTARRPDLQWTRDGSPWPSPSAGARTASSASTAAASRRSSGSPQRGPRHVPALVARRPQLRLRALRECDSKMKSSGRGPSRQSLVAAGERGRRKRLRTRPRGVARAFAAARILPAQRAAPALVEGGRLTFLSEHEDWARLYLCRFQRRGTGHRAQPGRLRGGGPGVGGGRPQRLLAANCGDLERRHVWRATVPRARSGARGRASPDQRPGLETSPWSPPTAAPSCPPQRRAARRPRRPALSLADGATAALVGSSGAGRPALRPW